MGATKAKMGSNMCLVPLHLLQLVPTFRLFLVSAKFKAIREASPFPSFFVVHIQNRDK